MLDRPYHPVILIRTLDSEVTNPTDMFSVGLLFSELQDSIRAETKAPRTNLIIDGYRRSLQRTICAS